MGSFGNSANNALASKLALAKLSEDLVVSPTRRAEFVADPGSFLSKLYGVRLDETDGEYVENLRRMVADGFCCGGCACATPEFGNRLANPALFGG